MVECEVTLDVERDFMDLLVPLWRVSSRFIENEASGKRNYYFQEKFFITFGRKCNSDTQHGSAVSRI